MPVNHFTFHFQQELQISHSALSEILNNLLAFKFFVRKPDDTITTFFILNVWLANYHDFIAQKRLDQNSNLRRMKEWKLTNKKHHFTEWDETQSGSGEGAGLSNSSKCWKTQITSLAAIVVEVLLPGKRDRHAKGGHKFFLCPRKILQIICKNKNKSAKAPGGLLAAFKNFSYLIIYSAYINLHLLMRSISSNSCRTDVHRRGRCYENHTGWCLRNWRLLPPSQGREILRLFERRYIILLKSIHQLKLCHSEFLIIRPKARY